MHHFVEQVRGFVDLLLLNQVVVELLLEAVVDLYESFHYMDSSRHRALLQRPLRIALPNQLVLRHGETPERLVVHLPGFGDQVLRFQELDVEQPDFRHLFHAKCT